MASTARKRPIKYRRGKPLPQLRHGDVVDLTTFPLGSRPLSGAKIALCPACGRKGERSVLRGGDEDYTHLKEFQTIFWMVREYHHVKAGD